MLNKNQSAAYLNNMTPSSLIVAQNLYASNQPTPSIDRKQKKKVKKMAMKRHSKQPEQIFKNMVNKLETSFDEND